MGFSLVTYFIAANMDPGSIPKGDQQPDNTTTAICRSLAIEMSHVVKDDYCDSCNCVGQRNYKFFIYFVYSLTINILYIFITTLYQLLYISNHASQFMPEPDKTALSSLESSSSEESDLLRALSSSPVHIFLLIYCFLMLWPVGGLSCYHTKLICANETTKEDTTRKFYQSQPPPSPSQPSFPVTTTTIVVEPIIIDPTDGDALPADQDDNYHYNYFHSVPEDIYSNPFYESLSHSLSRVTERTGTT
eukprot:gene227-277_t